MRGAGLGGGSASFPLLPSSRRNMPSSPRFFWAVTIPLWPLLPSLWPKQPAVSPSPWGKSHLSGDRGRFLNWFSVRWRNNIKRRTWNSSLSICMAVKPPMTTWHFAFLTQHFKATPEPLSAGKLDFATWKVSTKEVVSYFRVILQVALHELLRSLGEK